MMPKKEKWFKPEKETGWKKTQKPATRRRKLMAATDKRRSRHDQYVEAGRMINALANVTKDRETERKARSDAVYFFKRAEKTGKKRR